MEVLAGRPHELTPQLLESVERYRYKVFVEMLGWQLDTPPGLERDQFDHSGTLYLAARDAQQNVIGTARLLPTTQSYLLGDVFPQLMGGAEPPKDPLVWELSRFAAVDFTATGTGALGQFSSPVAVGLLEKAIEVAAAQGAQRLITVSPLGIERLLRREGFRAHRAAPPQIIDGHPIFACWIDVTPRCPPVARREMAH
ncbi:acyl-homoserine-lactone synthase [Variovorax soli]|jgi:N-acyl-L-homoserine lactone synthetase|uniref:acyl-homoserine-lactone synthase n=1 Tax=Variovorax soli TaxID=376815 RepID=UPI00083895EA|nr:acyl-homoserine-lactone synthase [Variovorax soli]